MKMSELRENALATSYVEQPDMVTGHELPNGRHIPAGLPGRMFTVDVLQAEPDGGGLTPYTVGIFTVRRDGPVEHWSTSADVLHFHELANALGCYQHRVAWRLERAAAHIGA